MMRALLLVLAALLAGCSRLDLADFEQATPRLELEQYFAGQLKAYGQFQDRFGQVKRRFVVDIEAALKLQLPTEDLRAELFERLDHLIARIDERVRQESA